MSSSCQTTPSAATTMLLLQVSYIVVVISLPILLGPSELLRNDATLYTSACALRSSFSLNRSHGMLARTTCTYAATCSCALADGLVVALRCSQHGPAAPLRRLQVRATRAQVVHALPAVVPAPAPLDDCRAACEVGLQSSFCQETGCVPVCHSQAWVRRVQRLRTAFAGSSDCQPWPLCQCCCMALSWRSLWLTT